MANQLLFINQIDSCIGYQKGKTMTFTSSIATIKYKLQEMETRPKKFYAFCLIEEKTRKKEKRNRKRKKKITLCHIDSQK